ncbi:integrase [Fibrobacteres bacterium R8-0-B4]
MSVTKVSPGVWLIKVSVRVPGADNPVKKRERFSGTKVEAECRESDIICQLKAGGSLAYTKNISTFAEAAELYKVKLQAQGRLSKHHLQKIDFVVRAFGRLPLEAVPEQFEAWRRHLANTPAPNGRMRSAATLNRPVEIVRAVFNHLVALDEIPKNPITAVRFPKYKEKARDRYLTGEERSRLLLAVKRRRPEMLPLVTYMLLVPCRVSELTTAKREQYNAFTNTIYIPDSKAGIPIHKPVPDCMVEYFRTIPADCPWLFYWADPQGRYRRFANFRRAWADALKIAGLSNLRVHDLRHIAVTDLYEAGNSEMAIMSAAGWKTNMMKTYYHMDGLSTAQRVMFKGGGKAGGEAGRDGEIEGGLGVLTKGA